MCSCTRRSGCRGQCLHRGSSRLARSRRGGARLRWPVPTPRKRPGCSSSTARGAGPRAAGRIVDSITSAAAATFMTPERGAEPAPEDAAWDLGGVEVVDARCSAHTLRSRTRRRWTTSRSSPSRAHKEAGGAPAARPRAKVQPSTIWATNFAQHYAHQVTDTWTITAKVPLACSAWARTSRSLRWNTWDAARWPPCSATTWRRYDGWPTTSTTPPRLAGHGHAGARPGPDHQRVGRRALGREALDDILLLRVTAYVREHLADPDLPGQHRGRDPRVGAAALQDLCAGRPPARAVDHRAAARTRPRGARTATSGAPPVTQVAHRWGFTSPSHFTRRFRGAYGMSPREWQALNRQ